MTEPAAPTTPAAPADPPATEPAPAAQPTEPEPTDWQAEARKWEKRAKENRDAAKELEKQRQASMTEAERAVAEAETRGAQTATAKFGQRLARTEFDAAAGRRNPDFDTKQVFEYLDLSRLVGEDGEPDTKAIKAAVERLVPPPVNGVPSFDGGGRGAPATGDDMNQLIRRGFGRG